MKIKYITYALLIVGLGILVGYRINKNNKPPAGSSGREAASRGNTSTRVDGIIVRPRDYANSISVSGSVDANEQVQLHSQVSGLVRKIYFKEGAEVKKGDLLLQIDNAELQAQYEQAIARENLASQNEKRSRTLLGREGISQQEYDVTLADLKALHAQSQLIRAQLSKTTLRAPFNGRIGLRSISEGDYLTPDRIIANLVNINPVKLTFSIPEKYSSEVKVKTKVVFTVAGSAKKNKARVYAVEPGIDAATRTLQLRALAENKEGEILPGAFATVELPITIVKDAILVPTEAIVPVQNGKKVFINKNGKAAEVKVETSARTEREVLIASGLQAGDTVITTGVMSLKAEMPVNVVIGKKP